MVILLGSDVLQSLQTLYIERILHVLPADEGSLREQEEIP